MGREIKRYFPLFVLPTLLCFALAFVIPFLLGVGLSFTRFTTVKDATFVGFGNFIEVMRDPSFLRALGFTSAVTGTSIILVNVAAILLALLLTRGIRGTNFFRGVFFMPNLIGGIVLGYIWNLLVNGILARFGTDITYSAKYGFAGLVALTGWQLIGYMMVIYIAGLQNVPKGLLEAAAIDGAGPVGTFFRIKLPLIMPSVTVSVFLTLTNCFKMFDQNLALTAGAPEKTTEMLALNIYDTFYARIGKQGVGQAKALVFFVIVAVLALLQLKLTRKGEVDA